MGKGCREYFERVMHQSQSLQRRRVLYLKQEGGVLLTLSMVNARSPDATFSGDLISICPPRRGYVWRVETRSCALEVVS